MPKDPWLSLKHRESRALKLIKTCEVLGKEWRDLLWLRRDDGRPDFHRLRASYSFIFRKSFDFNRFSVTHFQWINKLDFIVNQRFYCSHLAKVFVLFLILIFFWCIGHYRWFCCLFVRAFLAWVVLLHLSVW